MIPKEASDLTIFMAFWSVVYIAVDLLVHCLKSGSWDTAFSLTKAFNAISFANGLLLLLAMVNPHVLTLLGATGQFLFTAALLSTYHPLSEIFKPDKP